MIQNLPEKYKPIWKKALPYLKKGRPGDDQHAEETAKMILDYKGKLKMDYDVLVPVAMMHDIGHSAILPDHFQFVTGLKKIYNAKLVHMLSGAKIAKDILESVKYDKKKTKEIVNIISIHDFDQLKEVDWKAAYDTENKKIFHDFDALDRYTEKRLQSIKSVYKDRKKILEILDKMIELIFFEEFKEEARRRITKLTK